MRREIHCKNCIRMNNFPRAADNSYTSTRGNVYIVLSTRNSNTADITDDINLVRSTDYTNYPVITCKSEWWCYNYRSVGPYNIGWQQNRKIFISGLIQGKIRQEIFLQKVYGTVTTLTDWLFLLIQPYQNAPFQSEQYGCKSAGGEKIYRRPFWKFCNRNTSYVVWEDEKCKQSLGIQDIIRLLQWLLIQILWFRKQWQ